MKSINQRVGSVAQVLIGFLAAFQLGRYSEAFSGRSWAWIALILNLLLLGWVLLTLVKAAWKSEN